MSSSIRRATTTFALASLALAAAALTPACGGDESGSGGGASTPTLPPPTKHCQGTVLSCSLRPEKDCQDPSTGCFWLGTCTGLASSCFSFFSDQFGCDSQDGCSWSNIGGGSCSGIEKACEDFPASIGCGLQDGCHWEPGCTGEPTPCDELYDQASCSDHPGCYWG